jgi:hypothetical protein
MQTNFTDINQLAEGLVFNNYNSLFQGNRALENALSHNINLSYFSFNMFNYTNVFGFVNYSKRIDQVRTQINPSSIFQVSSPFNSNFADETVTANGRFERTFGKLKASLGGTFNYSKFNQIVNDERSINESFTQSYRARFSTNFRNAPNFELGYNLSINDYEQGAGRRKFYTNSPFANVDVYFLKRFVFKADYSYFNYRNETETINNYSFLDASLAYQKKDSKWEYKLGVTNILDTKSLNQDNSSVGLISTSEYFIQPRYAVLSVKYDL